LNWNIFPLLFLRFNDWFLAPLRRHRTEPSLPDSYARSSSSERNDSESDSFAPDEYAALVVEPCWSDNSPVSLRCLGLVDWLSVSSEEEYCPSAAVNIFSPIVMGDVLLSVLGWFWCASIYRQNERTFF
jgi:hypothetical protein